MSLQNKIGPSTDPSAQLVRTVGLVSVVLYGVGDILGAGVYGLIGRAAGEMGFGVWAAFLVSMVAAGLTGLSYSGLASRFDKAGGAAFFTHKSFGLSYLSYVVGMAAFASGLTSMATASRVFAGYFQGIFPLIDFTMIILAFSLLLGLIVFIGIKESLFINGVCTIIEVGGLLFVIAIGIPFWGSVDYLDFRSPVNPQGAFGVSLILSAAVLTFYSFVGFEDVINLSEEVKNPKKTIPKGILLAIGISSLIYLCLSISAVSVLNPSELANSKQPLVDVVRKAAPGVPPWIFGMVALFAVTNTALLNFIMGSRLMYGMAQQKLLPSFLAGVHARRKTPHRAVGVILVLLVFLGFIGDVSALAKSTSVLLLMCFLFVNLSLYKIQREDRQKSLRHEGFQPPSFVPLAGALVCVLMITQAQWKEITISFSLIAGVSVLYFVMKPTEDQLEKLD
jgi:basic amino acid/polyamine antiporter, APA family